jgi:predicted transcriptional regulator
VVQERERWQRKGRSRDLTGLGSLETEILRIVWDQGQVAVRDVYEELRLRRRIAYTTVMSVLRNLAAKGLLEIGRAHV